MRRDYKTVCEKSKNKKLCVRTPTNNSVKNDAIRKSPMDIDICESLMRKQTFTQSLEKKISLKITKKRNI